MSTTILIFILCFSHSERNEPTYSLQFLDSTSVKMDISKFADFSFDKNAVYIIYSGDSLHICHYDTNIIKTHCFGSFGEGPGEGRDVTRGGVFSINDTEYVIFSPPPKITLYREGKVIKEIPLKMMPEEAHLISDSLIIIGVLSWDGTKYYKVNIKKSDTPEFLFVCSLHHPAKRFSRIIKKNGLLGNPTSFSTHDSLIFIPDIFNGCIKIFALSGRLIGDKKIPLKGWYPTPLIRDPRPGHKGNWLVPFIKPFQSPVFLDSAIVIYVEDVYRNKWKEFKKMMKTQGKYKHAPYNHFLYIFDRDFHFCNAIKLPVKKIWKVYGHDNYIYVFKKKERGDNTFLIRYRFILKKVGNRN